MKRNLHIKENDAINKINEIYGEIPAKPIHLSCAVRSSDELFAAGKATYEENDLIIDLGDREATIPFISVVQNKVEVAPAIIYLSFESTVPNKYLPAEEIVDRGYSVFSLCLNEVSAFNRDFKSGISAQISRLRKRRLAPGKIAIWAWAAIRMIEYVSSLENVDKDKIVLAGHGVAARVALLASGNTDKTNYVIANGIISSPIPFIPELTISGISVSDMPYLYSPAFAEIPTFNEYIEIINFARDKHILIGSAEDGMYAGMLDEKLLLHNFEISTTENSKIPTDIDIPSRGEIHYHLRPGTDYLSREDWNIYLDIID